MLAVARTAARLFARCRINFTAVNAFHRLAANGAFYNLVKTFNKLFYFFVTIGAFILE